MFSGIKYGMGGYDPEKPNNNIIRTDVDNMDGTVTVTYFKSDGTLDREETIAGFPVSTPYPALDTTGALATLLAVEEVVTVEDASRAVKVPEENLIHEAEAWSLFS